MTEGKEQSYKKAGQLAWILAWPEGMMPRAKRPLTGLSHILLHHHHTVLLVCFIFLFFINFFFLKKFHHSFKFSFKTIHFKLYFNYTSAVYIVEMDDFRLAMDKLFLYL